MWGSGEDEIQCREVCGIRVRLGRRGELGVRGGQSGGRVGGSKRGLERTT